MCESARAISTNAAAKLPLNGISVEKAPEVRPHRPGIRLTDGMHHEEPGVGQTNLDPFPPVPS